MNTTYRLRFTKVGIVNEKSGEILEEILISNLPIDEFDIDDIIELYHLRWTTETSYNHLKNRMKMEEFSGYSTLLILQDIYTDCWLFNLVALKILKANIEKSIEQANEKYVIKRNFNKAIGVMKKYLIKSLMCENEEERERLLLVLDENITNQITKVKNNQHFDRKYPVNKSKMSYRSTY